MGRGPTEPPKPPLDLPLNEKSEQHLEVDKPCRICHHACLLDVFKHTLVCEKYHKFVMC